MFHRCAQFKLWYEFYRVEDLHLIYSGLHSSHVWWYVHSVWVALFTDHESRGLFKSYDCNILRSDYTSTDCSNTTVEEYE